MKDNYTKLETTETEIYNYMDPFPPLGRSYYFCQYKLPIIYYYRHYTITRFNERPIRMAKSSTFSR